MTFRRSPSRLAARKERAEYLRSTGDTRAADLMEARDSRQPKRLRAVRKGDTRTNWQAMRARVIEEQGGLCAWGGHRAASLDLAHLEPLGMGRSRHDTDSTLNRRDNLAGLCRRHHEEFDALPPELRAAAIERLKLATLPRDGHGARRGM